ncbi:hypothetical protein E2562_021446 [Oryza meyeriana var. granulata]|uniref:Uncharacterized protein n=1 Tax=Oryza meyeriana var. granulata TaxID=110450 RepID=A0A6G1C8D1_9ORYZ|nr:hypothetical protein E2562_021446 [Oryza meyeriana var. granulata]
MEAGTALYGGDAVRSPRRAEAGPPPLAMKVSKLYGGNAVRSLGRVEVGGWSTPFGDEGFGALRGQRCPEPARDTAGHTPSASRHPTKATALYGANAVRSLQRTWWRTTPSGVQDRSARLGGVLSWLVATITRRRVWRT